MHRVGFLPRLAAFLIDLGIFTVGVHALLLVDVVINMRTGLNVMGLVSLLGGGLLLVGYGLSEVLMAATPGKRLAGLVIAADNGDPATRGALLRRWALKQIAVFFAVPTVSLWVVLSPFNYHVPLHDFVKAGVVVLAVIDTVLTGILLFGVIGGCFLALGPGRQALHDKLAGTAVYRSDEVYAPRAFAAVVAGRTGGADDGDADGVAARR